MIPELKRHSSPVRAGIHRASIVLIVAGLLSFARAEQQSGVLVIKGQAGQAPVVQIDGRPYVDLRSLAELTNASLSFKANRIIMTFPSSSSSSAEVEPSPAASPSGLSSGFMQAGIETVALMREWASPLAYAIQNNYQVTEQWVAGYRENAANQLRLASVAASTDADRSALQLLTNEFQFVQQWSENLVAAKRSMDTAKYAMSPDALRNEPLSQKIIACGRFLATMLGSSSFQDDPSCH